MRKSELLIIYAFMAFMIATTSYITHIPYLKIFIVTTAIICFCGYSVIKTKEFYNGRKENQEIKG